MTKYNWPKGRLMVVPGPPDAIGGTHLTQRKTMGSP